MQTRSGILQAAQAHHNHDLCDPGKYGQREIEHRDFFLERSGLQGSASQHLSNRLEHDGSVTHPGRVHERRALLYNPTAHRQIPLCIRTHGIHTAYARHTHARLECICKRSKPVAAPLSPPSPCRERDWVPARAWNEAAARDEVNVDTLACSGANACAPRVCRV